MRVLVTGGTGLVGRALVPRLLIAGHEVVCMTRRPLLPASRGVTVLHGDLLHPEAISFADAGRLDVVFHLGALLPAEGVSDVALMTANAAGTAAVVEAARRQGASRFIYTSSVSVFGAPTRGIIGADTPIAPHTAYAVSKLAGEHCIGLAEQRGAVATSFRVSSIYGAGMVRTSVLPRFVDAALLGVPFGWFGEGARAQDFICAGDVAQACTQAAGARRSGVFVLASGVSTNMRALAELVAASIPGAEARRMGDHDLEDGRVRAYDAAPARAAFELPPMQSLAEGVRALIETERNATPATSWWRPC